MKRKYTGFILKDMKLEQEWKRRLERQKQRKTNNVETVDKGVDK